MSRPVLYKHLTGWEQLEHLLYYLVPAEKKKWIWRTMARKALALNRARIREQKNLDETPYASRADGGKKKMLTKILKGDPFNKGRSQTRVKMTEYGVALIQPWSVAAEHHFGAVKTEKAMNHAELEKQWQGLKEQNKDYKHGNRTSSTPEFGAAVMGKYGGTSQADTPCTTEQARILKREVGFKKLSLDGGKTKVAATLANLKKTFSISEAGYIIRKYRLKQGKHPKRSWRVSIPPRDVMGITEADERALMLLMKTLIAKYSYFDITMPTGAYEQWAAGFLQAA
ncbi:hypothetical protein KJ966_24620 [bacterium]|nr:hypothetical protein [bacterium]